LTLILILLPPKGGLGAQPQGFDFVFLPEGHHVHRPVRGIETCFQVRAYPEEKTMQIDNAILDQITQNVLGVFNMVGQTREEMTRKIRDLVQEGVEHFDLVSRDEFDAARELLGKTRIKLEQLEKQVAEMEKA